MVISIIQKKISPNFDKEIPLIKKIYIKTRNLVMKTRNMQFFFRLKEKKKDYKSHVIYKGIVLVVHVTLVKLNIMHKLDGMNIIIQIKVEIHQNTFEATSITILCGLSFQMLQKMLRPGRT